MLGALSALLPGNRCDLSLRDPLPHWTHLRDAAWWVREHLRHGGKPVSSQAQPAARPHPVAPQRPEELVAGRR